jgi:hypothetical protein
MWTKLTNDKKLEFLVKIILIYLTPGLHKDVQATGEAFNPQTRTLTNLNIKFYIFFLFLFVIFSLLDPDPDPEPFIVFTCECVDEDGTQMAEILE